MAEAQTAVRPHLAAQTGKAQRVRVFNALAHRDYRYLQAGSLSSQMGQWVQQLGQSWLVYHLTGSPLQLTLVAFFQGIAMLVLAPVGGNLADRLDRRKLMMSSQSCMTLVASLLFVLVATDAIRVWHIYLTSFISGALFSMNNPTRQTLVYDLVGREDLPNAIALNSVCMNTTRVIGPSLGGVLLSSVGVEGTYLGQAVGALFALWTTFMVRGGQRRTRPQSAPFLEGMTSGFRYVRRDRTIATILSLTVLSAVLGWAYVQLMPAYSAEVLGLGKTGYGFLMTAVGVGSMASALALVAVDIRRKGIVLLGALLGIGLLLIALGFSSAVPFSVPILALLGACTASTLTLTQTMMQMNVQDEYRGRVISLHFFSFGLQPLGTLPAGAIAEHLGVGTAMIVLGATMTALATPFALLARRVRSL